jgi:hypothetical protein
MHEAKKGGAADNGKADGMEGMDNGSGETGGMEGMDHSGM